MTMWASAFRHSTHPVTDALLHRAVLPQDAEPFERISAAIAVRAALRRSSDSRTHLVFLVPRATSRTARQIAAALLIGNHAHSHGHDRLPSDEARPLFKGDLLVVTPSVVEAKKVFEALLIGGQRLRDVWEVVPLTRRCRAHGSKPRVLLANPGWVMSLDAGDRFGAIVIDAAHPRTLSHLAAVLKAVAGRTETLFVVTPPLPAETLTSLGTASALSSWLWDPQTTIEAAHALGRAPEAQPIGQKTLWVCSGDAEAASSLERLYRRLIDISKCSGPHAYAGLQHSWFIYSRLRSLAAPLAQLEEVATGTWGGTLRQRLQLLKSSDGHGTALWDTTFPALCADVDAAYDTFLRRHETAKFWALAARLEQLLNVSRPSSSSLRIVVASSTEVDVLRRLLVDLSDVVGEGVADGTIEIATHSQDARLSAEGAWCHTLLLGPRGPRFRYMDILPSAPVEVFVYPFEVGIEAAAERRQEVHIAALGDPSRRIGYLTSLGWQPPTVAPRPTSTPWSTLQVREAEHGHSVEFSADSETTPLLDISKLLAVVDDDEETSFSRQEGASLDPHALGGDLALVTFRDGGTVRYPADHRLDVYFLATGQIQRHAAESLQAGWHVISFVDGQYDSLFRRLTEVLDGRLPGKDRVALELWAAAKQTLSRTTSTKRALHTLLRSKGLGATYEAFTTWFRDYDDDDGVLAPQQFDDFAILADVSGAFPSTRLVEQTFKAIQKSRGRNRAAGRHLRAFLRAVVSGDDHEDVLQSASTLDAALGDVLTAVEVLEVAAVRRVRRSH